VILPAERRGLYIDLLKMRRVLIEAAGIGALDQGRVDQHVLAHTAHLAVENEAAIGGYLAHPAALGLVRKKIETARHIGSRLLRVSFLGKRPGVERARDRRLLDDEMRIFGRQAL